MSRQPLLLILCFFACGLAQRAIAQETPAITTERPTVGFSPDVIPRGSFQDENGTNVLFQKTQYVVDLPENLLRLGLTDHFEVRFLTSNAVYQTSTSSFQSADAAVSTKVLLGGPNSIAPKTAALSLSFPTGGPSLTSGSYDPSLTLIWTQSVRRGYFFNELVGATLTTLEGARRPVWAPSIAGGRAFTGTFALFAEYAPTVLNDRSLVHVVDGGFVFTRKTLQQYDLRAGWQKDSAGEHALISFGYSRCFDKLFGPMRRLHGA